VLAYELKMKLAMHARTAIRGIAALGARSAFELHGGQSYVLGRCLPDHQGRIMSIDDMVCATQMAAPASMLQMQKMLSRRRQRVNL